jgi:hypothetical protein
LAVSFLIAVGVSLGLREAHLVMHETLFGFLRSKKKV